MYNTLSLLFHLGVSPTTWCCHMCRYRPLLPVSYIQSELAFPDQEKVMEFLKEKGAVFNPDSTKVDCKLSVVAVQSC